MSASNPWELYSSMTGWKACAARLDRYTASALTAMDRMLANGLTASDAVTRTFNHVVRLMEDPKNVHFGAADSEPRDRLAALIQKHLKTRHGHQNIYVDRWGGVG